MDIAIGIAVALLVAIIGLRLGKRRAEARLPPELVQALHLDKTDPTAARRVMDDYFMRQAAQDSQERAQLWKRAPTDLDAAVELRRRLLDDLATGTAARHELEKHAEPQPQTLKDIEQDGQEGRAQIARLDELIDRLRIR